MKESHNEIRLKVLVDNLLWMAARYAHGRHTYAPDMVRNAVKVMKLMYPEWEPMRDECIEQQKESSLGGLALRSDYLDDIFNS